MAKIEKTQIAAIQAIAKTVREERQSLAGIINAIIDCGEQFNVAKMLEVKLTATQSRKEQRNALYKAIVDNYPVRQRTDDGVTPAKFVRITCGKVVYAKLEPFAKYSFAFVQRAILNHLKGASPLEYTGTYFAVGKEGAKNVYRALGAKEIEQALAEITLQKEISEAAATLRKNYLQKQAARLHKQATEQVAAAHKGAADAEQPKEAKEAPKEAPKKGAKKGSKKQVAEQQTEAKEQPREQQVEQVAEPAPEAVNEA